jgi:hypothetical protein
MKKDCSRILIFAALVSSLFLLLTFTSKSGEAEKTATMTDVYKKLYFARVASDTAMNTAVLNRMALGDPATATNILEFRLKADVELMNSETNYAWSEQDKKAKALAEEYLKQNEKK